MAPRPQAEPIHLRRLTEAFERSEGTSVRAVVAVPCQHGKTICTMHAIVWLLIRNPRLKVAYVTYDARRALKIGKQLRQLARECGVQIAEEFDTITEWQTDEGGGVFCTSVDGGLTGETVDLLIVDDPYKNRAEAESAAGRDKVEEWYRGVANTRLTPGGSIFIVASRWHQEDLSGRVLATDPDFENITLKAVSDEGEPLCPWGPDPRAPRTLEFLLKLKRVLGSYEWESLYQGNPRPSTGAVFLDPTFGDPASEGRIIIGVDLAYTAGASADHSSACALHISRAGSAHVLEVARWRCSPTELAANLRRFFSGYAGAKAYSFTSGPESAVIQLLERDGVKISQMPAVGIAGSKYLRSQRTATAWNNGLITLPVGAPWADAFVREVRLFTGSGADSADDQVDAIVSAFEASQALSVKKRRRTGGERFM